MAGEADQDEVGRAVVVWKRLERAGFYGHAFPTAEHSGPKCVRIGVKTAGTAIDGISTLGAVPARDFWRR